MIPELVLICCLIGWQDFVLFNNSLKKIPIKCCALLSQVINRSVPGDNLIPPAHVRDAIEQVTRTVASRAAAILIRNPAVDIRFPDTSDLDFMVLADIEDLRSERL